MPDRMPLAKLIDSPFISLDETNIEMASILFLFVVVILANNVERRRQLVRHLVQAASIAVFFLIIYSCLGVFGMIRNGLYGLTLIGTAYTESFYWMSLPVVVIASCLIAGPVFCGWICPTGTIQELACAIRRRIVRDRGRPTRRQQIALGAVMALFLGFVVWLSATRNLFIEDSSLHWGSALLLLCYLVLIGLIDDLPTRSIRVVSLIAIVFTTVSHLVITSPVHFAFTARDDPASATTTVIIFVASLFVMRAWCRYLCPWGYLMGFLHRFSRLRIQIDPARCNHCRTCHGVCDTGAIDDDGVRQAHCQMCYACVDHCPSKAFEVIDVWRDQGALPAAVVGGGNKPATGAGAAG
ncbi:MAG: 4Fe-4S binding protein [Deltaproteobacteria bacterium]|nr:4Fe-4S binding protein [Deltaproteobacteria bacterium]